jgi:hypothetical protein
MILTHFLALVAVPTLVVTPAPSLLPLASTEPAVGDAGLGLALAPGLRVRAAVTVLPVRER